MLEVGPGSILSIWVWGVDVRMHEAIFMRVCI